MKTWELLSFAIAFGSFGLWTVIFFLMFASPIPLSSFEGFREENKFILAVECGILLYLTIFMAFQVYKGVKH